MKSGISWVVICALALLGMVPSCSPSAEAPSRVGDAVSLEGRVGQSHVSSEKTSEVVAHLQVKLEESSDGARPHANVALVIDSSGSMKGDAIAAAKAAAHRMIDALRDDDRLALVSFHSEAEVLMPSVPIDADERAMAKQRVDAMQARGTTDMAGGLERALDEVQRHFDPSGINRIVLLGDGIPNDASNVRSLAGRAGAQAITVTAFGLGDEYDETLMGDVAQLSGGRFHYVESPDKMLAFFEREAFRLDSVIARNTRLRLTPGPGVTIAAVVGQQIAHDGARAELSLGDMSRGDVRDLVVRLEAAPHKAGAAVELIDAVLSFDDPAGVMVERRVYLEATSSDSAALIERGRDHTVEQIAAKVGAAAATLAAIESHRQGDASARERLVEASRAAEQQARQTGDEALRRQAASMRELSESMPETSGPMPSPAVRQAPKKIRSAHDEAMQMVQ